MLYENYVKDIRFRALGTNFPMPIFRGLDKLFSRNGRSLEIANTRLPEEEPTMKQRLQPLCQIPRMSTFAVGAMINRAVSELDPGTCFVNVGVWNGFTLLCGMVDNPESRCIGIDNFSEFGGPRDAFLERFGRYRSSAHEFHEMDYRDYFENSHQGKIGFYIYDGEHSYRNQLEGLKIAEPFLTDNALIMVDDTNWEAPRRATLDFIEQSENTYSVILDETCCYPGHPTWWNGIMLLRRQSP
jgi:hypothetical protein